ncbi:phosphotransferase family protein [Streptomyces sp. NPDC088354]|uniref:phosphotransferase family protein n=1 Tax=Streptomyces sp. NPDC088354 TaxID=3365856 RepID=UPI00382C88AC
MNRAHVCNGVQRPHQNGGKWLRQAFDWQVRRTSPPRLHALWRDEGRRRLDNAIALEPVSDALVHGDLVGSNLHWSPDGKLIGVLDWDLALPFDPAIDAATMAWHGWDTIRDAVDLDTYRRARIWNQTPGVEHLIADLPGKPLSNVDSYIDHIVPWLKHHSP